MLVCRTLSRQGANESTPDKKQGGKAEQCDFKMERNGKRLEDCLCHKNEPTPTYEKMTRVAELSAMLLQYSIKMSLQGLCRDSVRTRGAVARGA
jgi:hypothetical protein